MDRDAEAGGPGLTAAGVTERGRGVDSLLEVGEREPLSIAASTVLFMVDVLATLSKLAVDEPDTVRFGRWVLPKV